MPFGIHMLVRVSKLKMYFVDDNFSIVPISFKVEKLGDGLTGEMSKCSKVIGILILTNGMVPHFRV
jgi:hypothetical protein